MLGAASLAGSPSWERDMDNTPKPSTGTIIKRFEADARSLVPVSDEIGGTVIYLNGRPAYYVLNGEWFQAVQGPAEGFKGRF